jgi:hypothetical protein
MDLSINVTEFACQLAHDELKRKFTSNGIFQKEKVYVEVDGDVQYTEEAQDIFNRLYNWHEAIIISYQTSTPVAQVRWYKSDIESLGYKCTDEQAEEVLYLAENNHDATVGINWEVLEEWCEYVGLQRKEELE